MATETFGYPQIGRFSPSSLFSTNPTPFLPLLLDDGPGGWSAWLVAGVGLYDSLILCGLWTPEGSLRGLIDGEGS